MHLWPKFWRYMTIQSSEIAADGDFDAVSRYIGNRVMIDAATTWLLTLSSLKSLRTAHQVRTSPADPSQ